MDRARRRHDFVECLQGHVAVNRQRRFQSERADTADFMAGDVGNLVDAEHLRLAPEARPHLLADPQAQRLRNPRRLDAEGRSGQCDRCRTRRGYDHGEVRRLFGEKRADGCKAHVAAPSLGSSDRAWMRWSGTTPSSSIWVRIALNKVSGAMRSLLTQASAIASGVTRSIHATLRPKALAPQASHGFDDTNSTSAGTTPRRDSIRV